MCKYHLIDQYGVNRGTAYDAYLLMPMVNLLEYLGLHITVVPEVI